MAMYYQGGSEIQADGLHTLYLMNPNFVENPTNMLHLNPGGATSPHVLNSTPVPILHTHQQVLSIPIANDPDRSSPFISPQQLIQGPAQNPVSRFGYNSWVDQEGGNRNQPQQTPRGLSLSLSTNQTGFSKPVNIDHQDLIQVQTLSKAWSSSSNGVNNNTMQSVVMGSKYLKAAQQLLDEVANVAKSITGDDKHNPGSKDKAKMVKDSDDGNNTEALSGGGSELTTAQRQEIQMKKSNLISMLDEVEQRYRQYNVQMQIIVASFEQAAGIGSAKSYTQVALKTISKQFRCLKDAISSQIKELSKSLGEVEGSKLRYVDNQLRQHRALQQLGMVQNNAWRPQRGLPERAVSVLRAWLFEHFLHPYPKDSDKQMLAKQTGLTRSQVSNWFINARVRLWKPMVEEMYLEEMKTQPQNNTTSSDQNTTTTTTKPDHQLNNHSTDHISASTISPQQGPNPGQLISSLNMENLPGNSWKKPRTDAGEDDDSPNSMLSVEMEMKATRSSYGTPYTTFQDISRFNPGAFHGNYNNTQNSVSLTLGLPPAGTHSHQQHNNGFLNFGTTTEAGLEIGYDQMLGFQNRKPFPAQLLHSDFVS